MSSIIILGGKSCSVDLSEVIYSFDFICRINCNLNI